MMDITINMKPIAKARPRLGYSCVYTPEVTRKAEDLIAWHIKAEMLKEGMVMTSKAVSIALEFCFTVPKNATKSEIDLYLRGKLYHTKKPDIDNLCKLALDALNGVVIHDDNQIIDLNAVKFYGEREFVKIHLEEI